MGIIINDPQKRSTFTFMYLQTKNVDFIKKNSKDLAGCGLEGGFQAKVAYKMPITNFYHKTYFSNWSQ